MILDEHSFTLWLLFRRNALNSFLQEAAIKSCSLKFVLNLKFVL